MRRSSWIRAGGGGYEIAVPGLHWDAPILNEWHQTTFGVTCARAFVGAGSQAWNCTRVRHLSWLSYPVVWCRSDWNEPPWLLLRLATCRGTSCSATQHSASGTHDLWAVTEPDARRRATCQTRHP
jgi:hypothetical protein